jgi:hypothetical protein
LHEVSHLAKTVQSEIYGSSVVAVFVTGGVVVQVGRVLGLAQEQVTQIL